MIVATELVNDNGISTVALAFFSALFTALSFVIVQIYKIKHTTKEAAENANVASEAAEAARQNTVNVSNGFASGMDTKLERIIRELSRLRASQDETNTSLRTHLEWHLDKENKK